MRPKPHPLPSAPDSAGSRALARCCYGGVTVWDERPSTQSAPVPRKFSYKGWLVRLAPSPDAVWIAAGCNDNTVRLWRRATGQELQCGGYSSKITGLSWSDSSRYLATSGGNQVTIWDFSGKGPAGSTPICCIGLSAEVTAISFEPEDGAASPSGTRPGDEIGRLAVGSADGSLSLFDLSMYEAGDIRIGKPHLCRPAAKYPERATPLDAPAAPKQASLLVRCHHGSTCPSSQVSCGFWTEGMCVCAGVFCTGCDDCDCMDRGRAAGSWLRLRALPPLRGRAGRRAQGRALTHAPHWLARSR